MTYQQRPNKALHPTAYSFARSSLRFRRRVSLVVVPLREMLPKPILSQWRFKMQPNRWDPILPHLKDFQSCLAAKVPPLGLKAATDRTWTQELYANRHLQEFPMKLRGVYLLFNSKEILQYIGVAMWCYNTRVWEWDSTPEFDRRFIDVIPVPEPYTFLALSLEFFLICRLNPPFNTIYRGYDCPEIPPG